MNPTDINLPSSLGFEKLQTNVVSKRYHVGLLAGILARWGGGRDLLRILALGLSEANVEITLVIPGLTFKQQGSYIKHDLLRIMRNLSRRGRARIPRPMGSDISIVEYLRQTGCKFDVMHTPAKSSGIARTLQRHQIDVVLPTESLGRECPVHWIGYLPDLQHKHLPHFFTQKMIEGRDRSFAALIKEARLVIVNSRDTKRDIEYYYPSETCEIFTLPFSPLLEPAWLEAEPQQVRQKYGLMNPYFLISNQFWLHKDHPTAIRALSLLADKNVDLVCTGDTDDTRAPGYFVSLQLLIEKLGLSGRVKIVGRLPKQDQIAIMRDAVAVLQPTLFEGGPGGGSVYNAVALGVPAIVSDLPINREIDDERVSFFAPGSAEALADRMEAALRTKHAPLSPSVLLERSAVRQKQLGAALRQLVEHALAPH